MLTPIIRHGFTFWEAPRSIKPPLPDLEDPPEDQTAEMFAERRDMSPEAVAKRERKNAIKRARLDRMKAVAIPIEIPGTLKAVQDAVMASFGIGPDQFFAPSRADHIALPRIASMALSRKLTEHPLQEIARVHSKDHGSVVHACERFEDLLKLNPEYRAKAKRAEAAIRGAPGPVV